MRLVALVIGSKTVVDASVVPDYAAGVEAENFRCPPCREVRQCALLGVDQHGKGNRESLYVRGDRFGGVAGVRVDADDLNLFIAILFLQIEQYRHIRITYRALRPE